MPDPKQILDSLQAPDAVKADIWDALSSASSPDEFKTRLDKLPLTPETRAALWDTKAATETGKTGQPEERSLSGFGGNILKSGANFAGGIVNAVSHPRDTLEGIGGVILGGLEKVVPGVPHHRDEPFFDAMTKFYTDRYGSLEAFKKAAYEDPVGVMADFSVVAGGIGEAAKAASLAADAAGATRTAATVGRVAGGLEKAAAVTDPVALTKGVVQQAGRLIPASVPKKLYESAMKLPPRQLTPQAREAIVATGLREQIPVSQSGVNKLSELIDGLNSEIQARIDAGAGAGVTVSPTAVANRLDDTRAVFRKQTNPGADLRAIDRKGAEWMNNHTVEVPVPAPQMTPQQAFLNQPPQPSTMRVEVPIPADEAQRLKQGTYRQLKDKAYKGNPPGPAEVEAQKGLARGLKEELAAQIPEIGGLNAREGSMIELDKELQKSVARIGNHQLFGIGTPIAAGGIKAMTGSDAMAAVGGVLRMVLEDPRVKSRLAIAIQVGRLRGKAPLATSTMTPVQRIDAIFGSQKAQ